MSVGAGYRLKSQFIPPPVDGLNLVSDPSRMKPTEARILDNYYIYDWGIRERAVADAVATPDTKYPTCMVPYSGLSEQGVVIVTKGNHVYKYIDGTGFTLLSGAGTPAVLSGFIYKKIVFLCDLSGATGSVPTYDPTTGTYAATSFTINALELPLHGFVFKNRVYFIYYNSSFIRYGDESAITGALSNQYDIAQFFQRGSRLCWGTSWSFNEGISNEELLVVGNDAGEVFVYSGDYPGADNWQLVARADIPAPMIWNHATGGTNGSGIGNAKKLGQDVLVNTVRGLISLKSVLAGRRGNVTGEYYGVSRNLGYVLSRGVADVSSMYPFAYYCADNDVYVLNYERGAWSKFPNIAAADEVVCVACSGPPPASTALVAGENPSYVLFGYWSSGTSGGLYRVKESTTTAADSTATYTYQSPYFNFGSSFQKHSKYADAILRVVFGLNSVEGTLYCLRDFRDAFTGTAGTAESGLHLTNAEHTLVRFSPSQNPGTWLSYRFTKTGSASYQAEYAGLNAHYEEGTI